MDAPQLQISTVVDALYAAVRERILRGHIAAGMPITEMSLANQHSVARPTAKAAMERLIQDGLLRKSSHKSAHVPVFDVEDVRDLYFSRSILEKGIVGELASQRSVPEAATRSVEELRAVDDAAPVHRVVEIDVTFHRSLLEALMSPRLTRLYLSQLSEVQLCMSQVQINQLLTPSRIAEEHAAILSAIEAGDVARARVEVSDHLEQAKLRLTAHLAKTDPDPSTRDPRP